MQTLERPKLENTTLYCREGSSDKIYQCAIAPAGERFVVNFAYGRRGSPTWHPARWVTVRRTCPWGEHPIDKIHRLER